MALRGKRRSQPGIVGKAILERPSVKLDHKIFEDCPSSKFGPLENFPLYGIMAPYILIVVRRREKGCRQRWKLRILNFRRRMTTSSNRTQNSRREMLKSTGNEENCRH